MTPEQLDHLQLLKTHLTNLLETAKKRTPGRWRHNEGRRMQLSALTLHQDPVLHGDEYELAGVDGDFIASCAGNAEAGWRSVKITAEWLIFMHDHGEGWRNLGLLDDLLAEWPLELITKHQ